MATVQLNFINQSHGAEVPRVVIFQRNEAETDPVIAWQVINHCGYGQNYPFVCGDDMQVGCSDSWGNATPQRPASPGQKFAMVISPSGPVLTFSGSTSGATVEVANQLGQGGIQALVFKSNRLLASVRSVAPGQTAAFEFAPELWIGVASGIVQGAMMNSAILASLNTKLSLAGIRSADIVMTGGMGAPLQFALQNVR